MANNNWTGLPTPSSRHELNTGNIVLIENSAGNTKTINMKNLLIMHNKGIMKPTAELLSPRHMWPAASLAILLFLLQGCVAPAAAPLIVGGAGATATINDERPAYTILDDNRIEFGIKDKVYDKFKPEKDIHLNVTCYNGVVLLSGETLTSTMREQVLNLARQQEKVRRVHNELRVTELSGLKSRAKDTWITSRVKAKMFGTENFKGSKIKVITEFGNVYLMGLVTRETGTQAAEITRQVDGVKRVVKLFEYFQTPGS